MIKDIIIHGCMMIIERIKQLNNKIDFIYFIIIKSIK